jgi:BlaI family transcriptional regulator, penicillinase repressor
MLTRHHLSAKSLAVMAKKLASADLSRRERQVLDVLYQAGRATCAEVQRVMPDPPSYSAVRTFLRILEEKKIVRHEQDGARYIYIPVVEKERARRSALRHMLNTFFGGSVTQAISALLDEDSKHLSEEDWQRLSLMIEEARKEGS